MAPPKPFTLDRLYARAPSPRRRPPFFRTKKVAFVGMTQSHAFAPWDDPTWTLAVHPCCHTVVPREPDWWFDLHPPSCFRKPKSWHKNYLKWLQTLRTPIFMQEEWPDIPMAIRFPKERILAEFRAYFTNHVAWMLAQCMTEGVTHVGIYGCEYAVEQERGAQRGSLEYWLGMFEGHGGHVILGPGSRLLNKPAELYGYESHDKETGALIAAYKPAKARVPAALPAVPPVPTGLALIDPHSAEGRTPLVPIPEVPVAWERSGHAIHQ